MTNEKEGERSPPPDGTSRVGRNVALGCLFAFPGLFGGGMIAVLVAKFVGSIQRCKPPEGFPACGTFEYLIPGAILGAVVLPGLILWRAIGRPGDGAK